MTINLQGEVVLRHLEQFLGGFTKRWISNNDDKAASFQVLLFPECPDSECFCLATYGLSAHELAIANNADMAVRMELIICADSTCDDNALAALLMAVGHELLKHHSTPGVHGVLPGNGPVLENPIFQGFYLALPGYFPVEFEVCENISPPVAICQLIPISSREAELVNNSGWRAFENAIVDQCADLLAFDRRIEIVFNK